MEDIIKYGRISGVATEETIQATFDEIIVNGQRIIHYSERIERIGGVNNIHYTIVLAKNQLKKQVL